MANRNDEALRALDYADMANTLRRISAQRKLYVDDVETLLEAANMLVKLGHAYDLTPRPEPAEAMGGEDARLRKVTEFALRRFMHDAYARANEAAQKTSGKPASVAEQFLRDAKDAERAITALSRPEPAGRVEAVAWQYRWKCDPTGFVYNTFVHPIEGNGRTEDEIEWWVYGVKPAAHAPQEGA